MQQDPNQNQNRPEPTNEAVPESAVNQPEGAQPIPSTPSVPPTQSEPIQVPQQAQPAQTTPVQPPPRPTGQPSTWSEAVKPTIAEDPQGDDPQPIPSPVEPLPDLPTQTEIAP